MAQSITECRNAIRQTDKRIDEVRAELRSRETIDPMCFISWGSAWAKHPDLREREHILFVHRADLNDALCAAEQKALPSFRTRNPPKCPTCKGSGYARAAA